MARRKKTSDEGWTLTMATLTIPRMEVMLVGGCHPPGRPTACKYAGHTYGSVTNSLIEAVLFPYNREWVGVAFGAAHHIKRAFGDDWTAFVMRVLVTGDPEAPSDVRACWKLEGKSEPADMPYPWDGEASCDSPSAQ